MFPKKPYDDPAAAYGPPPPAFGPPPPGFGPPTGDFGYDFTSRSPPPGSYYVEDVPQHFYKWWSPPGLVRALEAAVMLLCVAVFACVASTLAWEYGYGYGGVYGNGLGGFYGSGYFGGGVNYGYGYYGGVTNPRTANGFMMAMAVLCFLAQLGFLVAGLSRSGGSRSRRFYLAVLVASAVLALVMLVASIVYVVGVNPQAQMSGGGYYYSPLLAMCSQVYAGGTVLNQYLYHYCTVDPQEAVAIACGFLIVLLLCLICLFAHKTRSKIWKYGKHNIYWDKIPAAPEGPDVEEWVKNVSGGTSVPDEAATVAYSEKGATPPYSPPSYSDPPQIGPGAPPTPGSRKSDPDPATPSDDKSRSQPLSKPPARRGRRRGRRPPEPDESQYSQCSQYETDCTTAADSGDERDRERWHRLFPPVVSPGARRRYKEEFARELRRYKELCAHMDGVNERLAQLGRQLDQVPEDSPQYQALAEEYNHLKDLKRSPEYQEKKQESKTLRNKLFHIKRMVSDYDKLRG
ncbi:PREDICTED: occludin [Pseudopodoces humilis]|uniref:occludin n=1 Tax=Pseudopodoces humilis TaxID=181119 RepID=UPI0003955E0C|nr:PREDICTED: occludin [Pseudopodoces humilis]